jgi:2-succinyl-5-enolpyruvyl-6-hydroxy-3-cyclohexene-1-carboxylate synthase
MYEAWLIDQLVQQGVEHFCVAPGSRNTPLISAAAKHPNAKTHVHYDERGLGFFTLGLGKSTKKPAAIITTSGTALGNLLPSIMEAHHSCTPMILLTADRPHELRDCSANQTTDQTKIFQSFVRWQFDLTYDLDEKTIRSLTAQGVFFALQNPPGPIHINCPFREPLYRPHLKIMQGKPIEFHFPRHKIEKYKTTTSKGVILVGKLPFSKDILAILKLAEQLGWPVCADILSNARCFPTTQQIKYFDWNKNPNPEFVLHFGERMTSKKILEWLKNLQTEYIHVSPHPFLQDPERLLTARIQADISEFCQVFEAKYDPDWFKLWKDEKPLFNEKGTFTEIHGMQKISELLPSEYGVFLGNGMPIRDGDHFLFPKKCREFFGNRGLSGIDGNIATIAGLAEEMPILAIIGDQAALHDLNSLPLLKKSKHPIVLIVSNNFGGGIFHHLPVATSPHFEELWAAAHELRFRKAASFFDLPYLDFEKIDQAFDLGRSSLVELITNRAENYEYQKGRIFANK